MTDERSRVEKPQWSDGASPRILIVDDADDTRHLYASYLSCAGLSVEEAVDGAEALGVLAKSAPDLVVMDLAMPRMDGWETTRVIKSDPRTRHVPVIIVTSNAMPDQLDKARAAGADEILVKPCLPEALLGSVRDVLRRR